MDEIETELEEATKALKALDERRANQRAYRDDVIRKALDAGITWARIEQLTGLSTRGVQLSTRRTAE